MRFSLCWRTSEGQSARRASRFRHKIQQPIETEVVPRFTSRTAFLSRGSCGQRDECGDERPRIAATSAF
jgi:hypothetical protein